MNLIRLSILFAIALAIYMISLDSSNIWISNSSDQISRSTQLDGEIPNAYKVRIYFNEEDHTHTHTINGGSYLIYVEVMGSLNFLSTGKVSQMYCDLDCSISSGNGALTGNIEILRTVTVIGDKVEPEMKKDLMEKVIKIILKEIQNL